LESLRLKIHWNWKNENTLKLKDWKYTEIERLKIHWKWKYILFLSGSGGPKRELESLRLKIHWKWKSEYVANVEYAVKSFRMVQFNKTFFCFVGIHLQNNTNFTDARCRQYFISSVANIQSAVKSFIIVQFNKTFFCFVGIHMHNKGNIHIARLKKDWKWQILFSYKFMTYTEIERLKIHRKSMTHWPVTTLFNCFRVCFMNWCVRWMFVLVWCRCVLWRDRSWLYILFLSGSWGPKRELGS